MKYSLGMTPDYAVVYNILSAPVGWQFCLVGFIPLAIGIVVIIGKRRFGWSEPHWLLPIFAVGFGLLWLTIACITIPQAVFAARASYEKGNYRLVEGTVSDFVPMPYSGHQDECFTVKQERFCYSDFNLAPGFHQSASHGGPIHEGLQVRIGYRGGSILRLEIPRNELLSPDRSAAVAKSNEQAMQSRMQSDPFVRRMETAFAFTAFLWVLAWNLRWRDFMQFWVKPPNRPVVQIGFRIFFAANLIGASIHLVQQLHGQALTVQNFLQTLELTVAMCAAVTAMSAFGLWQAVRRRRKQEAKLVTGR